MDLYKPQRERERERERERGSSKNNKSTCRLIDFDLERIIRKRKGEIGYSWSDHTKSRSISVDLLMKIHLFLETFSLKPLESNIESSIYMSINPLPDDKI